MPKFLSERRIDPYIRHLIAQSTGGRCIPYRAQWPDHGLCVPGLAGPHTRSGKCDPRCVAGILSITNAYFRTGAGWLPTSAGTFSFVWPNSPEVAAADIEKFLSRGLQHHAPSDGELEAHPEVARWVKDAYAALLQLQKNPTREQPCACSMLFAPSSRQSHRFLARQCLRNLPLAMCDCGRSTRLVQSSRAKSMS